MSDWIISTDTNSYGTHYVDTFQVNSGVTLTVDAYNGSSRGDLVVYCKQAIIKGTIYALGKGYGGGGGGGGSAGWRSADHGKYCHYSGGTGGTGTAGGTNGSTPSCDHGGAGGHGGGTGYGAGGAATGTDYDVGNDGGSATKTSMVYDTSCRMGAGGGGGSGGTSQHTGAGVYGGEGAAGSGGGGSGGRGGGCIKIIADHKILIPGIIYTRGSHASGNGTKGGNSTDYGAAGGAGGSAASSGSSAAGAAGTTTIWVGAAGGVGGGGAGGDIVLSCVGVYGVTVSGTLDARGVNSSGSVQTGNGGNIKIFSTRTATLSGTLYYGAKYLKTTPKGYMVD